VAVRQFCVGEAAVDRAQARQVQPVGELRRQDCAEFGGCVDEVGSILTFTRCESTAV
jgi:hypothetical protein